MTKLRSSQLVIRSERREKLIDFLCCCAGTWLLMGLVFIAFYEGIN